MLKSQPLPKPDEIYTDPKGFFLGLIAGALVSIILTYTLPTKNKEVT